MSLPPVRVSLKPGTYFWCACGLSQKDPFCDGSHRGEGRVKSISFKVEEEKDVLLCLCKKTQNPPYCDQGQVQCQP